MAAIHLTSSHCTALWQNTIVVAHFVVAGLHACALRSVLSMSALTKAQLALS